MTVFAYTLLFTALTCAYAIFLTRVRDGLHALARDAAGSDAPQESGADPAHSVTVIVPARNESAAIAGCIASIAAQRYPEHLFECIIADDHSTDGTVDIALGACAGDPRFRVSVSAADAAGKKAAVSRAVSEARGEIIVTTDADCVHGPDWLGAMLRPFDHGVDLAAGPVLYFDGRTFFERIQALEFLGLVAVGAGLFGVGYPRICNGANLAYRKSAFLAAGGYDGNERIASGDDEYLLHRIVYERGGSAVFVPFPKAAARTHATPSLAAFFRQRVRWASKGMRSPDRRFMAFLMVMFAYMCAAASAPIIAMTSLQGAALAGMLLALKAALDLSVLLPAARLLHAPIRGMDFVIAELLHPVYLVSASLFGSMGSFAWKDRTYRNASSR